MMLKQPAIAFDQFCNCLIWIAGDGFGMADETLLRIVAQRGRAQPDAERLSRGR